MAIKLAAYLEKERAKPKLRLIDCVPREKPEPRLDGLSREMHYRRIRYLAGAYRLQWLVDQAIFACVNIEDLADDDLIALHADMEKARECPLEDVSFEDVGLVRSRI